MIGQLLLPLVLSTLAIAMPREADVDEISPGEMLPQRAVLRDLLPRQDSCGFDKKCGTGCMPIVGNCCAPEGDYYCSIGKYCTRGGCCQVGRTCIGSATTTHTSTIYGYRSSEAPMPTYTTPGDSNGSMTSSEVPPRMTDSPSPSESASMPTRTTSSSETKVTSSEEPSSSSAMPSSTAESSSQPSASASASQPPQVTVNAAIPDGAVGMGQLMGVAGLAIGILGAV